MKSKAHNFFIHLYNWLQIYRKITWYIWYARLWSQSSPYLRRNSRVVQECWRFYVSSFQMSINDCVITTVWPQSSPQNTPVVKHLLLGTLPPRTLLVSQMLESSANRWPKFKQGETINSGNNQIIVFFKQFSREKTI